MMWVEYIVCVCVVGGVCGVGGVCVWVVVGLRTPHSLHLQRARRPPFDPADPSAPTTAFAFNFFAFVVYLGIGMLTCVERPRRGGG